MKEALSHLVSAEESLAVLESKIQNTKTSLDDSEEGLRRCERLSRNIDTVRRSLNSQKYALVRMLLETVSHIDRYRDPTPFGEWKSVQFKYGVIHEVVFDKMLTSGGMRKIQVKQFYQSAEFEPLCRNRIQAIETFIEEVVPKSISEAAGTADKLQPIVDSLREILDKAERHLRAA